MDGETELHGAVVRERVRGVVVHSGLVDDDEPLLAKLVGVERRVHHRVRLDLEPESEGAGRHHHVVHRVGVARSRVETPPRGLDGVGDLADTVLVRSLEHHVLLKMGKSPCGIRLVGGSDPEPDVDRDDGVGVVLLEDHGEAVGQDRFQNAVRRVLALHDHTTGRGWLVAVPNRGACFWPGYSTEGRWEEQAENKRERKRRGGC